VWTAAIVGGLAFPIYPHLLRLLFGRDPQQPLRVFLRIVREDMQPRFAALDPGGPDGGVLLLVAFDGEPDAWRPVFDAWRPRQGFIDADMAGEVAVVHWSSPLMYARAVNALGDLIARLPFPTRAGLYRRTMRASGTDRTPRA